ncbi:Uncharacterised protein [Streptococcus pneumoniae]|nr:Uncharacterised protein [Streptococcus pneumoniae]
MLVDRCGDLDRQTHRGLAERGGQLPVGLVVHEEHGGLGDLGRPPVDLDSVEPVDVDPLIQAHVEGEVLRSGAAALVGQQVRLDLAQLGVGQVQEVAGPAS